MSQDKKAESTIKNTCKAHWKFKNKKKLQCISINNIEKD